MKNLTKNALAVACAIAISACSSSNKGADNYSDLVQRNTTEQNQKALANAEAQAKTAEEQVKAAETAKVEAEAKLEALTQQHSATQADLDKAKIDLENAKAELQALKDKIQAEADEKKKQEEEAKRIELAKETSINALSQSVVDNTEVGATTLELSGAIVSNSAGTLTVTPVAKEVTKNLNSLVIDGQVIELVSESDWKKELNGESVSESKLAKQNEAKVLNISSNNISGKLAGIPVNDKYTNSNAQMRYGYITKDGKTSLFIQGYMTPITERMNSEFSIYSVYSGSGRGDTLKPMSNDPGVYSYIGKSFYGKDDSYQEYDVTAEVDFANKKVKANVLEKDTTKFTLGGNINGNTFAGQVGDMVTKGAFYGTKGIDIGAMYYNTSTLENGVFGATQKMEGEGWRAKVVVDSSKDLSHFEVKELPETK